LVYILYVVQIKFAEEYVQKITVLSASYVFSVHIRQYFVSDRSGQS